MKKFILKMKMKYECSLVKKNMQLKGEIKKLKGEIKKLKGEIKKLKELLEETKEQNHKLIDEKTLDKIKIRKLMLEGKNE